MLLGALFRDGNVCVACKGKTRRRPSVLLEDGHVKTNSVVFLEDFLSHNVLSEHFFCFTGLLFIDYGFQFMFFMCECAFLSLHAFLVLFI